MSAEIIPFPQLRPKPPQPPDDTLLVRLQRVLARLEAQQGGRQ